MDKRKTIAAIVLVFVSCVLLTLFFFKPKKNIITSSMSSGSCSASCTKDAIDNVNDPAYNVRLTIENALLIEDHLANKRRYCKPCLTKHLLLQHSYLSEAVWMACKDCKNYPKLLESEKLFNEIFERWRKNMDDDNVRLDTLDKVRQWRQEMIKLYYFS